ncbi:hypothetical protein LF1_58580 [Rubripirellula obstinata]|uniref:Uncharacterized protein n=1 Tax=Rubripirellula obstinata TaxID=406547 RepID=A0A5B1C6Z2_9BACT|nr:hypothetical protein LF1_58580 [Rubripirellula obstinata]
MFTLWFPVEESIRGWIVGNRPQRTSCSITALHVEFTKRSSLIGLRELGLYDQVDASVWKKKWIVGTSVRSVTGEVC